MPSDDSRPHAGDSRPQAIDREMVLGVAEGLDLVLISPDEILVQFGTRSHPSQLFCDPNLTGILARTVGPLLKGPKKLGDLLAAMGDEAEAAAEQIIDLLDQGILADIRTSAVEQYLAYTFTGNSTLSGHRVGLIGAGPVGVARWSFSTTAQPTRFGPSLCQRIRVLAATGKPRPPSCSGDISPRGARSRGSPRRGARRERRRAACRWVRFGSTRAGTDGNIGLVRPLFCGCPAPDEAEKFWRE